MSYAEEFSEHPLLGVIQTIHDSEPLPFSANDLGELLLRTGPDDLPIVRGGDDIYQLGPHGLVLRHNSGYPGWSLPSTPNELFEHMRWATNERQVLRTCGVLAIQHTTFAVERDPYHAKVPGMPSLYTVAERLASGETLQDRLQRNDPGATPIALRLAKGLLAYYSRGGKQLSEPAFFVQYAPDGRLIDLDP